MGQCNVKGWGMTGTRRDAYSAERTNETFEGTPVVRMWRSSEGVDEFGAMYQVFKADAYRGKRVRLSAALRTVDVTERASLCLRVDGPRKNEHLAFDNMFERPAITGTTDWARQACVVDVPGEATNIFISNILAGGGELHWADVRFEVVDDSVPVTDMTPHEPPAYPSAPVNLDFSAPPRAAGDPLFGRAPPGWRLWGGHADSYSAEVTSETFEGKPVVRMWRFGEGTAGGAGIVQSVDARAYLGKRVRLSAALRAVDMRVGRLTLRIDGPGRDNVLAFDNMDPRVISGTTDWSRHACVVDVPPEAALIMISSGGDGGGALYTSDFRFEVVDESVPVTDMRRRSPTNLDFSEE